MKSTLLALAILAVLALAGLRNTSNLDTISSGPNSEIIRLVNTGDTPDVVAQKVRAQAGHAVVELVQPMRPIQLDY